jgi:hypothetical protein
MSHPNQWKKKTLLKRRIKSEVRPRSSIGLEHLTFNEGVSGSSPDGVTKKSYCTEREKGDLANHHRLSDIL